MGTRMQATKLKNRSAMRTCVGINLVPRVSYLTGNEVVWGFQSNKGLIDHQFRYIKIQPKTLDLSTRLWGINTEFVGFIPQSLVLKLNFNVSKLVYCSCRA